MRPYIHGRRNLIHIIDVRETIRGLLRARKYLKQVASSGVLVLFVGTKRQGAEAGGRAGEESKGSKPAPKAKANVKRAVPKPPPKT